MFDFGPGNAFWLFACERLNGILGAVPTNHHQIETQLMRKFITTQQTFQGTDLQTEISTLVQPFRSVKGSLKQEDLLELPCILDLSLSSQDEINKRCELLPPIKEGCFSTSDISLIEESLRSCIGDHYVRTLMLHKYSKCARFHGELYGSRNSIHSGSSLLLVKHCTQPYNLTPGFAVKFFNVFVIVNEGLGSRQTQKTISVYLASISWLDEHEQRDWFGQPILVQSTSVGNCSISFVPFNNISCKCAHISQ